MFVWIPEGPTTNAGPLYAIQEGGRGPLGTVSTLERTPARPAVTQKDVAPRSEDSFGFAYGM